LGASSRCGRSTGPHCEIRHYSSSKLGALSQLDTPLPLPFSLDDSLNDVYIDLLFVPSSAHYRHLASFRVTFYGFLATLHLSFLFERESLVLRFTDSRPILLRLRRQKPLLSLLYISACSALFSSHYSTIRVLNSCGRERSIDLGWAGKGLIDTFCFQDMGRDGRGAFYDCAYDEGEFLSSPGNELWRCFDRGEISV
jgi:hypothetical protein